MSEYESTGSVHAPVALSKTAGGSQIRLGVNEARKNIASGMKLVICQGTGVGEGERWHE